VAEPSTDGIREPYVVEAVKRQFLRDPRFGETYEERYDRLFGGGLELHTTIQPELQEAARETIDAHFPDDAPTAAIASVEPDTGAIVAMHGGRDFGTEQFNLAMQGRKQPGSAFKPFVMLEALRQGFPADLVLDGSSPMTFELGDRRDDWEVRNYGGNSFEEVDLAEATRRSINTYYAQLILMVGVDATAELTEELGISPAAYGTGAYESISIGGLDRGVTPLEMASAYSALANEGVRAEPYLLASVSENGEDLWVHEAEERRVLSDAVTAVGVDMLREAVENGTGTAARIDGWDVAGKTGTTNNNFAAWFAGFTPALSTAVWVGHPETDVRMPDATGGGVAAPLWHDFMVRALEHYEPADFPEVDPDALAALFEGEETDVPDVVGLEEAEALRELASARLIGEVTQVRSHAPSGEVVRQSIDPDTSVEFGTRVEISVSTGQPPPAPPPPPPPPDDVPGSDESSDDDSDDDSSDDGGNGGNGNGSGNGNGNGNGGNGNGGNGNGNGNGGNGGNGGDDDEDGEASSSDAAGGEDADDSDDSDDS
jgi:penicillin-binding protein 1A